MTFLWIFSRPAARPGLARARAAGSGAHGSRGRCLAERLLCLRNHGEKSGKIVDEMDGWLVVWNLNLICPIILGMSSSQHIPTDSYFSEGLKPPTRWFYRGFGLYDSFIEGSNCIECTPIRSPIWEDGNGRPIIGGRGS